MDNKFIDIKFIDFELIDMKNHKASKTIDIIIHRHDN